MGAGSQVVDAAGATAIDFFVSAGGVMLRDGAGQSALSVNASAQASSTADAQGASSLALTGLGAATSLAEAIALGNIVVTAQGVYQTILPGEPPTAGNFSFVPGPTASSFAFSDDGPSASEFNWIN
jgi:hypothetical protein